MSSVALMLAAASGQRNALPAGVVGAASEPAASPRPRLGTLTMRSKGEVVGRLRDDAQIRRGIADFGALVEAGTAMTR